MAQHNFTRRTFTALAELIGDVESGKVNPSNVRAEVIARFELGDQPDFKEDKFTRHADTQREFNRKPAGELRTGDAFCYNGMVFRAHKVEHVERVVSDGTDYVVLTCFPERGRSAQDRHTVGLAIQFAFYPDELV